MLPDYTEMRQKMKKTGQTSFSDIGSSVKKVKPTAKLVIALLVLLAVGGLGLLSNEIDGFSTLMSKLHLGWNTLLKLIAVTAAMYVVHYLATRIVVFFAKRGRRARTLSTVLSSVVKYATVLLGICWGLSILGVNVSTIFASMGIVALILGFGAESLVADLVTGVFMLFENQFDVDDIIEVDGCRGVVQTVGIRTVTIRDAGGNLKIINNSDLKNIVNRSNLQSFAVSDISCSYAEDLEALEEKIPSMLDRIYRQRQEKESGTTPLYLGKPEYVGVQSLADSAVVLRFRVSVEEQRIFEGCRMLNRDLKIAFDRAGVEIPFPQLDIHNR